MKRKKEVERKMPLNFGAAKYAYKKTYLTIKKQPLDRTNSMFLKTKSKQKLKLPPKNKKQAQNRFLNDLK